MVPLGREEGKGRWRGREEGRDEGGGGRSLYSTHNKWFLLLCTMVFNTPHRCRNIHVQLTWCIADLKFLKHHQNLWMKVTGTVHSELDGENCTVNKDSTETHIVRPAAMHKYPTAYRKHYVRLCATHQNGTCTPWVVSVSHTLYW